MGGIRVTQTERQRKRDQAETDSGRHLERWKEMKAEKIRGTDKLRRKSAEEQEKECRQPRPAERGHTELMT